MGNYRLCVKFVEDAIESSMKNHVDQYDSEVVKEWDNNPWKYVKYRMLHEISTQRGRITTKEINVQRVSNWLNGVAIYEIPVESFKQLQLRDKWGYTTNDDKWCNDFMNVIAGQLINGLWQRDLI